MASKGTDTTPEVTNDVADVQADAAPEVESDDDLAEVESAIDDAQRQTEEVASDVDDAMLESVEGAIEEAQGESEDASDAIDEIVNAIEQVEGREQTSGEDASLEDYDSAIAGAVDDLLEGDFVSVDLVLEGMNETTPPPEAPEKAEAEAPADESADEAVDEAREDASVTTQADGLQEAVKLKTNRERAAQPEVDGNDAPASAGDATEETAEPESTASDEVTDTADELEGEAVAAEPAPVAAKAATPAKESSPPRRAKEPVDKAPASAAAPSRNALAIVMDVVRPAMKYGVMPMLEMMSMPVNLLPPKTRDIIDWIALSLIFWVPIVWIYAVFIVG